MKNINEKGYRDCCGCGVCAVICPTNSIDITMNTDGFYYPIIKTTSCIYCGKCRLVCSKYLFLQNTNENFFANKEVYASWSKNTDLVSRTSSGGVAAELATRALDKGYHICGVALEDNSWFCAHSITQNPKELKNFEGSKYTQSYTVEAFSKFKKDEKYLVFGTPCQIHSLKEYINHRNIQNNFILIDFFCHGVPSRLLLKKYKEFLEKKYNDKASYINFRKKSNDDWREYSIAIQNEQGILIHQKNHHKDLFFKFYLQNSCLNKPCYKCIFRHEMCSSDIRLGDFWGPTYRDNHKGVSIVIINSIAGKKLYTTCQEFLISHKSNFDQLQSSQHTKHMVPSPHRDSVSKLLQTELTLEQVYKYTLRPKLIFSLFLLMRRVLKKLAK